LLAAALVHVVRCEDLVRGAALDGETDAGREGRARDERDARDERLLRLGE